MSKVGSRCQGLSADTANGCWKHEAADVRMPVVTACLTMADEWQLNHLRMTNSRVDKRESQVSKSTNQVDKG